MATILDPQLALARHRAQIDAIDAQLATLLIERIGVIQQVAALKAAHWPRQCHIRPGREGQMHQAIAQRFAQSPFPVTMALAIWRQLIGGSTDIESRLKVCYAANRPEQAWLAREYFGVNVGLAAYETGAQALAQLARGESTILLMPADLTAPDWAHAPALQAAGLRVFAALPVMDAPLPAGAQPALALAALSPEDSGDDCSLFLHPDGRITPHHGFATELAGALYLGSYPHRITLTQDTAYA